MNFTTAIFDGLEDGVNLDPTTDLLHTNYKSVSIFTTPLQTGQSITYDPNDGLGNWWYFYEGTSALSGDIGTGLFNFLDAQGTTVVNGIPKPDVGITWVSGGQDDNDGNTATNPQLFKHVNLTTLKRDGTESNDWDVGNNSTSTRLVTWKYTDDGSHRVTAERSPYFPDTHRSGLCDLRRQYPAGRSCPMPHPLPSPYRERRHPP